MSSEINIYTFNWFCLYYFSYADLEFKPSTDIYEILKKLISNFPDAYELKLKESNYTKAVESTSLMKELDKIVPLFIELIRKKDSEHNVLDDLIIKLKRKKFIIETEKKDNFQLITNLRDILFSFTDKPVNNIVTIEEFIVLILKTMIIGIHNKHRMIWFQVFVENINIVGKSKYLNEDLMTLFLFLKTEEKLEYNIFFEKLDTFLTEKCYIKNTEQYNDSEKNNKKQRII